MIIAKFTKLDQDFESCFGSSTYLSRRGRRESHQGPRSPFET